MKTTKTIRSLCPFRPVRTTVMDRALWLEPQAKIQGQPVALLSVLPSGASVTVPGQGEGIVEYSPRHYVRIDPSADFEPTESLVAALIDADATITF